MNLGVDFGSTYSSFATYNVANAIVELCKPTHSYSEAVPTVACLDENDRIITGHEAREQIKDDPDTVSFEAFKMLLTEADTELLKKRGYTGEYTPRCMAEKFLGQQIRKILTGFHQERIENLVICAPEVWTTKEFATRGMLDGRVTLRDICKQTMQVDEVQVVSEPAAASAYFAHDYQKKTGKRLTGHVLIIDYGGGTLDLTLTQIRSGKKDKNAVEIEVKNRAGVGENHPGKIGDAGIAYMEEVVRLAIAESGNEEISGDLKDPRFRKAYLALERKLKGQVQSGNGNTDADEESYRLCNAVEDCADDISQMEENDECFAVISYGKVKVTVTFSHLLRAYNAVIRQRLEECLRAMTAYMDARSISYQHANEDDFHIVLVGGFCKFILVQKQIEDFFRFSSTGDRRFAFDLGPNREFAVAMGAALLADKVITINHTAPYAIGISSHLADHTDVPNFAIQYRQEISEGDECWICNEIGAEKGKKKTPKLFINASGSVKALLIGYDADGKQSHKLVIKAELAEKIENAYRELREEYAQKFPEYSNLGMEHNIGFQMDDSEIVTLLIRAVKTNSLKKIELSSYQDMFELTEI